MLAKRLSGSFHCTDLGVSLFDAEFYDLFVEVICKIDILHFFKIYPLFEMPSAEQLQMRLPIHVSHQNAAQLLWSACRIHFHCATINVHGYVTKLTCEMHFQLCSRRFRRCYFL